MKVGWYYHRLRAMTVSELTHRVSERWKHRSDASFAKSLQGFALGAAAESVISLPNAGTVSEALKQVLAQDAGSLMRGDWKLFGWREVNVGLPPRWHEDVTCGVALAADAIAHELDHRALPGGADVRTIWEINRWSEPVRLLMHSWVNRDLKAARVAVAWLEDWCHENPVGRGVNWTSPLEAGLRLLNFVWFETLLKETLGALQHVEGEALVTWNALKRAQRALAQHIVPAHAAWVWRYRSFGSSANNHLLGELVGLLHAVKQWPSLEALVGPADKLWQQISQCVLEQFAEDGGNKEQALHYHLFAWEMAWHAARLMRVTDGPVIDRLKKAAAFLVRVAHDGEQWEYGDNDDAQIVPLTLERKHAVAEWRVWMGGKSADSSSADALRFWLGEFPHDNTPPVPAGWWTAPQSGMAVCERDGWKARLDASPLGYGSMAAHGHCDALHVSLWDGPCAVVIDPGTGGYYGMKKQRAALAAWSAHNGPQPAAGFASPIRMGAFLWTAHHASPVLETSRSDGATARLRDGAGEFARTVDLDETGAVIVSDFGSHAARFVVHWCLAPGCHVVEEGPRAYAFSRLGRTWRVKFSGDDVRCETRSAEVSERYGLFEDGIQLVVSSVRLLQSVWSRANGS